MDRIHSSSRYNQMHVDMLENKCRGITKMRSAENSAMCFYFVIIKENPSLRIGYLPTHIDPL